MTDIHQDPPPRLAKDRKRRALIMHADLMHATAIDAAKAVTKGRYDLALQLLGEVRVYLEMAEQLIEGWRDEK